MGDQFTKKKRDSNNNTSSKSPDSQKYALNIPASLFANRNVSVFEVLVEYLVEKQELSLKEIAILTNRSNKTIWTVYNRAKKKHLELKTLKTVSQDSKIFIPLSVLLDRTYSVLETLVVYLKERENYTYHEIAQILTRDDRTIWTVYSRAKKKTQSKTETIAEKKTSAQNKTQSKKIQVKNGKR